METQTFQQRLSAFGRFISANATYILIGAVLLGMIYISVQQHFEARAIERQHEAIEAFDKSMQKNRDDTRQMTDAVNQTVSATNSVLEGLKDMKGTVNQLVENDRQFNLEVNNLRREYSNARNQNQKSPHAARSNVPLLQREQDALRADRELYPDAGDGGTK